jgi:uroporphyrinogen decarboxylase
MLSRRQFLMSAAVAAPARLTGRQRVDRALAGADLDRPPFSFWYHFGLEKEPGERHARATLDFHRKLRTDLVKVMSDYPFPKPPGPWWEVRALTNPFPQQVRALQLIGQALRGRNYFVETIFNSWNQAEKISSPAEVRRLMHEKPQALLDALEAINRSQIHHARLALRAGAAGIFLAIANADENVLTREEYRRFSEPFDRELLEAVRQAPLNILHLHGERVYLDLFYKGWLARVIHYSVHATGVGFDQVRRSYTGVLMGGLDERHFRKLSEDELRQQWLQAQQAAGRRFILAPGCSVPNDTTDDELMRLVRVLEA